ncbi:DNA polymerase III subunit epsilon [Comamonas sp. NLF-1-9]|uniref:DNA polymerase III subunit epsilon n=1 Tax=Comamonas sp. NLF-1-9 TaxID=2853163 RepID=UPI001C44C8CD|nr:DNA polymerase III subunit epsilon [Comamonas sp. NLF-1-9]QXL85083.1 DNA polymerase III subunit epsilon [Comamonas sp. NLF-1-9]
MTSNAVRQIVLDTETTGLSAEQGDRIVELGCVELVGRRLTGNNLHLYFNPERESEEGALRVHGLSSEFLRDKPKFAECAEQIFGYLQGAELIIHNAAFDMGFLEMEFARLKRPPLAAALAGVLDTLMLARDLYPGKRNTLDALCDRLEVDRSDRTLHGALLDAELLASVYIQMTRGQESLLVAPGVVDSPQAIAAAALDLSGFDLPVLLADARELAAHEAVLLQIDKASAGQTVWKPARDATQAVP